MIKIPWSYLGINIEGDDGLVCDTYRLYLRCREWRRQMIEQAREPAL